MNTYVTHALPQVSRVTRNPQHTFQLQHRPFVLQPFGIAPILPGETLKNALVQSRCVTDPIRSSLVGWWLEHYLFFVKLTDFSGMAVPASDISVSKQFQNMMIAPAFDLATSGLPSPSAVVPEYFQTTAVGDNQINYVRHCLNIVTEMYFRDAGESQATHSVTHLGRSMPLAKINQNSWMDSVTLDAAMAALGDVNVDLNANATITAGEVETALARYEMIRMQGLTTMTWEEYLQTYGVNIPASEIGKPELIRFSREWQYPSNTVEPTTGVPTSAVSWSVAFRADKDRFFKEPGFIFGVTCARPKIYLGNQKGAAVSVMNDIYSWMPGAMPDANISLKKLAAGKGPVTVFADSWWLDVRDLLIYGDQFLNFDTTTVGKNMVTLPTAANERRFVETLADLASFFVDNADTADAKKQWVRQDGVMSLSILGRQVDTSPAYQIGV